MTKRALLPWTYSVRWSLRHLPCPGAEVLGRAEVPAGAPCPDALKRLSKPGDGYAVFIDFAQPVGVRWSPERKAAARRRRLAERIDRVAPLFADELLGRELAARPGYFAGDPLDAEPD